MTDDESTFSIDFLVFASYLSPCCYRFTIFRHSLHPVPFVLYSARFRLPGTVHPPECLADAEADIRSIQAIQRRPKRENGMIKSLLATAGSTTSFVVWDTLWSSARDPQIPNHHLQESVLVLPFKVSAI